MPCVGLSENFPHRLRYLNTCFSLVGLVWIVLGDIAQHHSKFVLPASCWQFKKWAPSFHSATMEPKTQASSSFYRPPWSWCFIVATEKYLTRLNASFSSFFLKVVVGTNIYISFMQFTRFCQHNGPQKTVTLVFIPNSIKYFYLFSKQRFIYIPVTRKLNLLHQRTKTVIWNYYPIPYVHALFYMFCHNFMGYIQYLSCLQRSRTRLGEPKMTGMVKGRVCKSTGPL